MRNLFTKFSLFAITCFLILYAQVGGVIAATIYYTDNEQYQLTIPHPDLVNWLGISSMSSLIPLEASNNVIIVDYTIGGSITDPAFVFGGQAINANAYSNIVNISNGFAERDVFGGAAYNGNAYNNTLNISGNTKIDRLVFGGKSTGIAYGNTVNITDTVIIGSHVYGGRTDDGDAFNNTVNISGSPSINGTILGGFSENGNVKGNKATITGGSALYLYGGRVEHGGTAAENVVEMSGGTITNNIYGGYAVSNGLATQNRVNISGGTVGDRVLGGFAYTGGDATYNVVEISGGTIENRVYGGSAEGGGDAAYNSVKISGDTTQIDIHVIGGYSDTGEAYYNTIDIVGGNIHGSIYGGEGDIGAAFNSVKISGATTQIDNHVLGSYSGNGKVSYNTVDIAGGNIQGNVFGGEGYAGAAFNTVIINGASTVIGISGNLNTGIVTAGYSSNAAAENNVVIMTAGTVNELQGAYGLTASYNQVQLSGGKLVNGVFGALGETAAEYNSVLVSGGQLELYGVVWGAGTHTGNATGNIVNITGGEGFKSIIGGRTGGNGNSEYNHIYISGGVFNDSAEIIAGHATDYIGNQGDAINNIITISGNPILTTARIYGGESSSGGGDFFTGNTLNIAGFAGEVGYLKNFENYNFLLKSSLTNGGTVLSVTSTTEYTDLTNTTITITGVESGASFKPGDQITLISKTQNIFDTFAGQNVLQGVLLAYDFEHVSSVTDALTVQITSVNTQPSAKAFSEGRLASLAFVNQGSDFIANQAISRAVQNTRSEGYVAPFVVIGGGKSRYQSGSHINVEGISALAGLALGNDLNAGHLTLGGFFEAGWGNYNTHNSFNNAPSVKGDGDTEYYGGGLLGRFDFNGSSLGNFYSEASARIGSVSNDFSSSDLGIAGQKAKYDSDSLYYGLHAGLGYIFNLTQQTKLDTYGKFFWLHQNSDSVTILGDKLKFDDADSIRARLGGRLSIDLLPGFTPYGGAAYEYEFSGKAKAKASGYSVLTPEIKGGSGLFEVGGVVQPDLGMGLYFDFAAQGYVGKREGVSGSLTVSLSF